MRILFDKNVPKQLRRFLSGHQVLTSAQLGWGRLENGALLKAAEAADFGVMVTADQSLSYQQNLSERTIALVVLGSNRWPYVQKHISEIVDAVAATQTNSFAFVEIPLPPKIYRPKVE